MRLNYFMPFYRNITLCIIIGILLDGLNSPVFAESEYFPIDYSANDTLLSKNIMHIGSRLELIVDIYLIAKLVGKAKQRLHNPVPKEIALVHDAPWEGSGSGYHNIFKDGDIYRMYYKGEQLTVTENQLVTDAHPLWTCYAES